MCGTPFAARIASTFRWMVSTSVEPPCGLYRGDQVPDAQQGWSASNVTGYASAEFDAACNAALAAADPAAKRQRHAEAMAIFTRDLPALPLFARAKVLVTNPRVTGVALDSTQSSELWNVENFDVSGP